MLAEEFKNELIGAKIIDDYIQETCLIKTNGMPCLIFQVDNHYFALSKNPMSGVNFYLITEINEPTRDAYALCDPVGMSKNKMREYLKMLIIKSRAN